MTNRWFNNITYNWNTNDWQTLRSLARACIDEDSHWKQWAYAIQYDRISTHLPTNAYLSAMTSRPMKG